MGNKITSELIKEGELSDRELDNVSGGRADCDSMKSKDPLTVLYCPYFECKICGSKGPKRHCVINEIPKCSVCKYLSMIFGECGHPEAQKREKQS